MDGMTRNGMGWAVVQEALEKMPMTAEAAERMAVQPRRLCTRMLLTRVKLVCGRYSRHATRS